MTGPIDHISLDRRFATIADLERAARRRIPGFAFDYLAGGVGNEACLKRNSDAFDQYCLAGDLIVDIVQPDLSVNVFGKTYDRPFGIAPIGLSGLVWPKMAEHFATGAAEANIPAVLSTVATTSLEKFAGIADKNAWFQLYIPNDEEITQSLIARAKGAGYEVLVVTVDVPVLSRRPRDIRNGLSVPPKKTIKTFLQAAMRPRWALTTLAAGMPEFENLKQYVPAGTDMRSAASYTSRLARGHVTVEKLKKVRASWPGKLVVKGIMNAHDLDTAKNLGADAVWVSNHGGRQLDSSRASLDVIGELRATAGVDYPLFLDSGVRSGLDVARALSAGADFVFLGRGFSYAVAALGASGVPHAVHILEQELKTAMVQTGCADISALRKI